MKKRIFETFGRRIILSSFLLSALAIVAISCNKEDSVTVAETNGSEMELKSSRANPPGSESIAEIAIAAGFSELVGALSYVDAELDAGLVDLFLNGKDQYTVFAPMNSAFEDLYDFLGIGGITDLAPELVLDVLLYHVTEGRRAANSVVPRVGTRTVTTLLGKTFTVNPKGEINDIFGQTAEIVGPNVSASNGIIHIIDTVLLPLE